MLACIFTGQMDHQACKPTLPILPFNAHQLKHFTSSNSVFESDFILPCYASYIHSKSRKEQPLTNAFIYITLETNTLIYTRTKV